MGNINLQLAKHRAPRVHRENIKIKPYKRPQVPAIIVMPETTTMNMASNSVHRAQQGNIKVQADRHIVRIALLANIKTKIQEKRLVNFVLLGGIKMWRRALPANSAVLGSTIRKPGRMQRVTA